MGGKVAVVARFMDNKIVAFKVHTSYLQYNLNTPNILEENWLKKLIVKDELLKDDYYSPEEADDYDNNKAIQAPYHYGIVLIDYIGKKIISANNFMSMLKGSSMNMDRQYMESLQTNFKAGISRGEKVEYYDMKESLFREYYTAHYINYALKNNVPIKKDDTLLIHNRTMEGVIGAIYELPLENKNKEEQLEILRMHFDRDMQKNNITLDEYGNVSFDFPHFSIVEGEGACDTKIVLDYMENNNFLLSSYEKKVWREFIEENKNS